MLINMRDIDKIIDAALLYLGYSGRAAVEFKIIDPVEMRKINLKYRGQDKPTDVLSFPYLTLDSKAFDKAGYPNEYDGESGGVLLGSILICEEVAEKQAEEYGHGIKREMTYLFVHGLLHLLGFDHANDDDKQLMRNIEEEIISRLLCLK